MTLLFWKALYLVFPLWPICSNIHTPVQQSCHAEVPVCHHKPTVDQHIAWGYNSLRWGQGYKCQLCFFSAIMLVCERENTQPWPFSKKCNMHANWLLHFTKQISTFCHIVMHVHTAQKKRSRWMEPLGRYRFYSSTQYLINVFFTFALCYNYKILHFLWFYFKQNCEKLWFIFFYNSNLKCLRTSFLIEK